MATKYNFKNNPGYDKLEEAFQRSNSDFLNSIELAPEEDVYFSPRYEKKMARLIKRRKRPYWKFINTMGKKVIAITIVIIMLFGLSMTAEAVRKPVIGFIVDVFEKFSELFIEKSETQNTPGKIEKIYTLTGLPDEYEEILFKIDDIRVETKWSNGDNIITLYQTVLNAKITFDTEKSDATQIFIDGTEAFYKCNGQTAQLFWIDGSYIFIIECSDFASQNILAELFKSSEIR